MKSRLQIGFGKKVRACWLDWALARAAGGANFEEAKDELANEIATHNPGTDAVRKIQNGLKRVWFSPPDYCRELHTAALLLFRQTDDADTRLLLNWGMAAAAYPFIGDVAEIIGRLFKLQSEARRSDIDRRIRERHGDRDFVSRITRYDVSSFLDWGVISEAKEVGVYLPGKQLPPRNAEQIAWLVEAVLISRGETQIPTSQLCHHPLLFPVKLDILNASLLKVNPRLRIERQSLNEEFVSILHPNMKP